MFFALVAFDEMKHMDRPIVCRRKIYFKIQKILDHVTLKYVFVFETRLLSLVRIVNLTMNGK